MDLLIIHESFMKNELIFKYLDRNFKIKSNEFSVYFCLIFENFNFLVSSFKYYRSKFNCISKR